MVFTGVHYAAVVLDERETARIASRRAILGQSQQEPNSMVEVLDVRQQVLVGRRYIVDATTGTKVQCLTPSDNSLEVEAAEETSTALVTLDDTVKMASDTVKMTSDEINRHGGINLRTQPDGGNCKVAYFFFDYALADILFWYIFCT